MEFARSIRKRFFAGRDHVENRQIFVVQHAACGRGRRIIVEWSQPVFIIFVGFAQRLAVLLLVLGGWRAEDRAAGEGIVVVEVGGIGLEEINAASGDGLQDGIGLISR